MTNKKHQKLLNGTAPKLVLVLVLASLLAFATYKLTYKNNGEDSSSNTIDGVNLDPPTQEELKQAAENKDRLVNQQDQPTLETDPETSKKQVSPQVTYAGQYGSSVEVGAFVPVIIELNGTCTLTLTKGDVTKTNTVQAVNNASSTDCPVMSVANTELSPGTWSASVKYNSPSSVGTSESKNIEVK